MKNDATELCTGQHGTLNADMSCFGSNENRDTDRWSPNHQEEEKNIGKGKSILRIGTTLLNEGPT